MGCWSNFTILQTFFFPLQHFQGPPAPFRGIPGSDKMYNPSSMFVVSYPVGTREEKPQRGGGREASGYSSRLSSASEDFPEPNRMQPKQHSGRYICCLSLNVTVTFMKLGFF